MALFGLREQLPMDEQIAAYTAEAFAAQGIATVVVRDEAHGIALRASEDSFYPLHNLIAWCADLPQRQWKKEAANHVRRLLTTANSPSITELTADELRRDVRSRILAEVLDDLPISLSYGRPVSAGLVEALCIDFPETIIWIDGEKIGDLALPVDELFDHGRINTRAEPIDFEEDVTAGIRAFGGGSLFIASKALSIESILHERGTPTPHGVVFAIPHRQQLLYAVPKDSSVLESINALLHITTFAATQQSESLPGGLLSQAIYFVKNGVIQEIGGPDPETGELRVIADGPFADMLTELSA
jgi:hypothetical protein